MLLTRENTPRWLIFVIDIVIAVSAVFLAYMLRFNFAIPASELRQLPQVVVYMTLERAASFIIARSYAGIIRYTSTGDALRVFGTVLVGSITFAITNLVTYYFLGNYFFRFPHLLNQ